MGTLLETERLRLREFRIQDADRLVSLDADPEVMRYISRGVATPREVISEKILPAWLEMYSKPRPIGFWAAERRNDGEFVGWLHLRPDRLSAPEQELGYRFFRHSWGQGYASEGGRALIDLAFDRLSCKVVSARTLVANLASQRVMHKCGLRFEEHFTYPQTMLPTWSEEERRAIKYSITRTRHDRQREASATSAKSASAPVCQSNSAAKVTPLAS
jgi:RimJ/RimL family protein N-acetyltransferase